MLGIHFLGSYLQLHRNYFGFEMISAALTSIFIFARHLKYFLINLKKAGTN